MTRRAFLDACIDPAAAVPSPETPPGGGILIGCLEAAA